MGFVLKAATHSPFHFTLNIPLMPQYDLLKNKRFSLLFIFSIIHILFIELIFYQTCFAASYKFLDKNGVLHLTDEPIFNSHNKKKIKKVKKILKKRVRKKKTKQTNKITKEDLFSFEINKASKKYGVDSLLVKSVIKAESNFNPHAVSKKGALGLMQLMPKTASIYNVKEPFKPAQNIDGGVRHLKFLFKQFRGDLKKILAAYNAGEDAVKKYKGIPPYKETKNYVKKVIATYKKYKKDFRPPIYKYVLKDGTLLYTDTPNPLLMLAGN